MKKRLNDTESLRRLRLSQSFTGHQLAQPRISEIACNKADKLSLGYLVGLCAKASLSVEHRMGGKSCSVHANEQ